ALPPGPRGRSFGLRALRRPGLRHRLRSRTRKWLRKRRRHVRTLRRQGLQALPGRCRTPRDAPWKARISSRRALSPQAAVVRRRRRTGCLAARLRPPPRRHAIAARFLRVPPDEPERSLIVDRADSLFVLIRSPAGGRASSVECRSPDSNALIAQ